MALKRIKLTKQQPQTSPLNPVKIDTPNLKGTLPFPVASAISPDGKKDVYINDAIRQEQENILNEKVEVPEHIKKATPEIKPPVDFESLSKEEQQETLEAIKSYNKEITSIPKPKSATPFIPRGPGIAAAKKLADKIAEEPVEAVEVKTDTGSDKEEIKCIRCGWTHGDNNYNAPDKIDKQVFVAAVLGQKRFMKSYSLLGGALRVTFRSLTPKENDMVVNQLTKDWNDGKLTGPAHSLVEAVKYQMVLALQAIDNATGNQNLPALDEYDFDDEEIKKLGTPLPLVVDHLFSTVIVSESVKRILAKSYNNFLDLLTQLEAIADSADF